MKDPRKQNTRIKIIQIVSFLLLCSSSILAQDLTTKDYKKQQAGLSLVQNLEKYNFNSIKFYDASRHWENYNYYNSFMGSFCKFEHQSSTASGMAIRMRLGNLNTVNSMEMKLPAWQKIMLEESRY